MTDKELLEASARAAGIEITEHEGVLFVQRSMVHKREWNPLTYDGDALRLAVKLELTINPYTRGVFVSRDEGEPVIRNEWSLDRAKTTRRAIVRAAAEIGSSHNAESNGRTSDPTRTPS